MTHDLETLAGWPAIIQDEGNITNAFLAFRLAVFSSDALSSVAYATEEILLVLTWPERRWWDTPSHQSLHHRPVDHF